MENPVLNHPLAAMRVFLQVFRASRKEESLAKTEKPAKMSSSTYVFVI
jgi:hypothetical protein